MVEYSEIPPFTLRYDFFLMQSASGGNPLWRRCIAFGILLFDPVVRYGAGFPNAGYEVENDGEPP
ncbi:hypothetical protein BJP34_19595 [Moorena producens PAL-8-15-08-1]|uniref:Uncharacterized protein n=1 Tax=Moorena producens PAL-8-15-08-1 TaxID=1458985 RepID=A0A1D8TUM6_9CYAN|nr:hypothetical protein BJP34_19595 [Moorena producens PAL-8-15-08-1]